MTLPQLTLVLGGARSGKSRHGEALVTAAPAPWIYMATARPFDPEMTARIADHRRRRGEGWQTVEVPVALGQAIAELPLEAPVLVDCLTLWLTNLLLEEHDVSGATDALELAIETRSGPTVLVSNEVSLGVVPDNALARTFREEAGRLHQRLAARAGRVLFMVAGIPMIVK